MADEKDEVVWLSCRAGGRNGKCEGKQAIKTRSFGTPGQGCVINYKCLTCNKPFNVNY